MSASVAGAWRGQGAENITLGAERMADALADAFARWRNSDYARRRDAIDVIAQSAGCSVELMENSIEALLKPFTSDALKAMAARFSARVQIGKPKTIGFIMAGNVAGAGIHEIAIALIAGARVVVKTASAEPIFFAELARTLAEVDRDAGARIEVVNWSRARADLTAELIADCDLVIAYGDDATIESLNRSNVIGFGSRVSAAVIAVGAIDPPRIDAMAELLARDVVLFEQLGCLSLHQVFVISPHASGARDFAIRMSVALEQTAKIMAPARIPLLDAIAIRGVRERARWRANAGEAVALFEGRGLTWTVVFEPKADALNVSPGFRTLYVTGVRDLREFRDCIAGVSRRIEAIAVAGDEAQASETRTAMTEIGIPYVCAPGEMQSPPLDWRHGGGAFIDMMVRPR